MSRTIVVPGQQEVTAADGLPNPTTSEVISDNMVYDPVNQVWNRAVGTKVIDLDTTAGVEYNIGVNLRTFGSGGSVEAGTTLNPVWTNLVSGGGGGGGFSVVAVAGGSLVAYQGGGWSIAAFGIGGSFYVQQPGATLLNTYAYQLTASNLNAQVQGAAASGATKGGNPVQAGGVFNTTQPTVTTGQAVELQATARGALIVASGVDAVNTTPSQATAANLNAQAVGNVASGSTDSGNPVKIGMLAKTALPTAVSDAQRVNAIADKFGRQITIPQGMRDIVVTQTTTISASTSETTVLTAVASTFLDITAITIANTSTTGVRVDIRDATAGSVKFSWWVPSSQTMGAVFSVPIPQSAVNNNWTVQSSASVTDLRVYVVAVKNK